LQNSQLHDYFLVDGQQLPWRSIDHNGLLLAYAVALLYAFCFSSPWKFLSQLKSDLHRL
jgi:hypothetical protein